MSKIPLPFRSARLAGAIMLGLATTSASAFDITGKYCDTPSRCVNPATTQGMVTTVSYTHLTLPTKA